MCVSICIPSLPAFPDIRRLNGIGAGPAETIQPAVIADIFFLHDRGKWNTLYWVVYMGSLMIGPIISGAMATHVGWRNFWWLNVALLGLSFLMVLFMFPETKWDRIHPDNVKDSAASSLKQEANEVEKTGGVHRDTEVSPAPEQSLEPVHTADRDPWLGRGGPSKQQWKLFQSNAQPVKSIMMDLWLPWKLFAFPISEFASFVVSWSCSSFLTLNLTQTQAFAAPPYLWNSQSIGTCTGSSSPNPTNMLRLHKLRRPRRRNDRPRHGRAPL
jgi:MFS family permease